MSADLESPSQKKQHPLGFPNERGFQEKGLLSRLGASHKLVLITFVPFVHTARRSYSQDTS